MTGRPVERHCDRCNLTRTYTTPAYAARHWPRHGCDERVAVAARAAERAAHLAATAIVRDCQCLTVRHEHGELGAYITDRCRCTPCRAASAASGRETCRQRAYGRWDPWRDAAPIREHVRSLMAAGLAWQRVAAVSGVPVNTLSHLLYGNRGRPLPKKCRTVTADRFLAVCPSLDLADDGGKWVTLGASRRLQALSCLGWSQRYLADRLGWPQCTVQGVQYARFAKMTVAHARQVNALYDELSMTLPPRGTRWEKQTATRCQNAARANGWLPPLAWDDDLIDDPTHEPVHGRRTRITHDPLIDESAIERRMGGDKTVRLSAADRVELVRRWEASGRSMAECERATGVHPQRARQDVAS